MKDRDDNGVEIPIRISKENNHKCTENSGKESAAGEAPEDTVTTEKVEQPDVFAQLCSTITQQGDHLEKPDEILRWIREVSGASQDLKEWAAPMLQRLVKAEIQAWENHDLHLRASAELDNYRKRAMQEKSRILRYKNEELLRDLLPIVDNLQRALDHPVNAEGAEAFVNGVRMISAMFRDTLERYGVKEITAADEKFDPNWHEALSRVPMADKEPNTIIQELEKGYTYQDRLLRPSRVVVSGPVEVAEENQQTTQ